MQPMLTLVEDDVFYFDEAAADRAVKFIETFCIHWEGEYAGKPFTLIPWERQVTRDLFGWKYRTTHLRRFRELYLEIGKGNGKSPWLAAVGEYMLLADGEAGAHVISAATDFKQANITFDFACKMIPGHPRIAKICDIKQFHIEGPKNSRWDIISGTPEGKHGLRPTCLLMDEAHEWPNRKLYDTLSMNAGKRRNSLILTATNAGASKDTIAWELHERAEKVLTGKSKEVGLYPVIFATDKNDPIDSVETWKKANPSYDHIASLPGYLETEAQKARQNPALEARFRRLNLSQWVQGADKWLDLVRWDTCATGFKKADVAGLPCFLGLDISQNDDLSSLVRVWTGPDRWFVRQTSWIPKATARKYEDRDSIPYSQWAEEGRIKLLDEETVDDAVKRRIAKGIIKFGDDHDVKAVCYDRWRASVAIARLERAGITCIPVKQGFELSGACLELERRLKDGSIVFQRDPVFRWMAGNVEVLADRQGNIRPVKPSAKGPYAGLRSAKIDAIAAMLNAITQILRAQMGEKEEPKKWNGVFEFLGS